MLKQAGIVVAGVAASIVAVSPLAFAGEKMSHHESGSSVTGIDKSGKGLINVSGNNLNVPIQACNNDFPINGGVGAAQGNVKDLAGAITGAAALFGKADSSTAIKTDSDRKCGLTSAAGDTVK